MMRFSCLSNGIFFSGLVILAGCSFNAEAKKNSKTSEKKDQAHGLSQKNNSATQEDRAPSKMVFKAENVTIPSEDSTKNGTWPEAYSDFIRRSLGTQQFSRLYYMSGSKLAFACPRYETFNPVERANFWVAFFKSLAYGESSFNRSSGPKTGIMQLTCDRNHKIGYGCDCRNSSYLRKNSFVGINCAMKIIQQKSGKRIYPNHPYFEVLRDYIKGKPGVDPSKNFMESIRKERSPSCVRKVDEIKT